MAVALVRQPIRRKQIALWATRAALLAPVLTLAPSWILIPIPAKAIPPIVEDNNPAVKPTDSASALRPALPVRPPSPQPSRPAAGLTGVTEPRSVAVAPPVAPSEREVSVAVVPPVSPPVLPIGVGATRAKPESTPSTIAPTRSLWDTFSPTAVALGMFLAASGIFVGRWLIGHLVVLHIVHGARHATGQVARLFATQAADFAEPPRLLISERITVPVCFGLSRPTVLLPTSLVESAGETTLRWVIAHELAHLRNGDVWAAFWFGLAQSLYFALPWFWWLKRRVALCQEYVADAAAAAVTGRAEDYADCRLNPPRAAAPTRRPLAATGVLGRPSDLYRRISTLLEERGSMKRRTTLAERLLTATVLLGVGIGLAGIGLYRPAAAQESPEKKDSPKKDEKGDEPKKPAGFDQEDLTKQIQKMQEMMQKRLAEQQKMIEEMQKRMQERGFGGPIDHNQRIQQIQEEARKRMEETRKRIEEAQKRGGIGRFQMLPGFQQANPFGGFGGFGGLNQNHARLGAVIEKPSPAMVDQLDLPKDQGVVIGDVTPDSAAAKAGLKPHDVLLELGGKAVSNGPTEFRKQLNEIKANTPVDAVVLRKGKKESVKGINLPEAKPDQPGFPGFGGGIEIGPGIELNVKPIPVPPVPVPDLKELAAPFAPGAK